MKVKFLCTTALGLLLGLSRASAAEEEVTAWRLFVSDHADAKVTVVDAVENTILETLVVKGPASLFRSKSGASVFAVQGADGAVTAIATGIAFDDHGDHGDIEVGAPKLTGAELTGDQPSHFVEHDGKFAAFFDGEGVANNPPAGGAMCGAASQSIRPASLSCRSKAERRLMARDPGVRESVSLLQGLGTLGDLSRPEAQNRGDPA